MGVAIQTKMKIFEAYEKLLLGSKGKNVTIKNISEACDISRKAVYYHFSNIEELQQWGFRTKLAEYLQRMCPEENLVYPAQNLRDPYRDLPFYYRKLVGIRMIDNSPFFCALIQYIRDNWLYFRYIMQNNGNDFSHYLGNLYSAELGRDIRIVAGGRALPKSIAMNLTNQVFFSSILSYFILPTLEVQPTKDTLLDDIPNYHHNNLKNAVDYYFETHEERYFIPHVYRSENHNS